MSKLVDCPTCGGLLPEGRQCCPHCHCKYSGHKKWTLAAAAVLGLGAGAAGCGGTTAHQDGGAPDMAVTADLSGNDSFLAVEYGPAMPLDLSNADAE